MFQGSSRLVLLVGHKHPHFPESRKTKKKQSHTKPGCLPLSRHPRVCRFPFVLHFGLTALNFELYQQSKKKKEKKSPRKTQPSPQLRSWRGPRSGVRLVGAEGLKLCAQRPESKQAARAGRRCGSAGRPLPAARAECRAPLTASAAA